jgi:DNA polymerase elongation subunit (family B)
MKYPNVIREFAKTRMEQIDNNAAIAREIKEKFKLTTELEALRIMVSSLRLKLKIKAQQQSFKRLFFDIETSYHTCRVWRTGKIDWLSPEMIINHKQIICISYKWQGEDEVHTLDWSIGEKEMLKKFIKVLEQADEIIGHNGDRFDIKELRTRCINYGLLMFPTYRTLDTLKKAREYFNFASNKLDYIGKYLNVGRKMEHEGLQMWIDVVENKDKNALERMKSYCQGDVILLEDVYTALSPYITHNNNFAVLRGGEKWECPECASDDVQMHHTYTTAMGIVRRNMKCNHCKKQYKISNKTYMSMLQHSIVNN